MIGLVSDKNYHQKTKWQVTKKLTKLNQDAFQDCHKSSHESSVSMEQSAKDTRDTSDHTCILIWNPV